jgi:hypothetical protein
LSALRQVSSTADWDVDTPLDPASDCRAVFVAVVLQETPEKVRKKQATTRTKRAGVTRRAPGSPAREVALTRR